MVVEPFRTDFAGRSLTQSAQPVADYADTAGRRRKDHDTAHGTQQDVPSLGGIDPTANKLTGWCGCGESSVRPCCCCRIEGSAITWGGT